MTICHHQGCNDIGVVIDSNEMTSITYFTSAMILGTGNLTKSFTGAFFLQYGRDILEKVFIIENTVRKGKS